MRRFQPRDQFLRHGDARAFPSRRADEIGLVDQMAVVLSLDEEAAMGAERPRLDGATGVTVPALAHLGPRQPEDLGDNAEFEGAETIIDKGDDERT